MGTILERLITLREAISLADESAPEAALFLPPDGLWTLETRCALLEVDPYKDSDVVPPFAEKQALSCSLSVSQLQDIVNNARQQVGEPTSEQLFAAFVFYYDCDAFIVFG